MINKDANVVCISGKVVSDPEFYYVSSKGEMFYSFFIESPRLSDAIDVLNVAIKKEILDTISIKKDSKYLINGSFESYNKTYEGEKRKLLLYISVANIIEIQENEVIERDKINPYLLDKVSIYLKDDFQDINQIYIEGTVCRDVIFRETPLGSKISDVCIGVNSKNGKSFYIPLILWNKQAICAERYLSISSKIQIIGRVQSREYNKNTHDGEVKILTAYEVSVKEINF